MSNAMYMTTKFYLLKINYLLLNFHKNYNFISNILLNLNNVIHKELLQLRKKSNFYYLYVPTTYYKANLIILIFVCH